ncbi:MAG TPA: DUF5329 family protein [Burkholderiaceae bacterium]|nr:DUF5329 family protein [Burkholderiaceae bacterium]
MRPLVAALLLAVGAGAGGAETIDPAVAALLRDVETSGCRMERNGELHEGKAAAEHLRMKLERSGHPGMSADQFIDRVASGSTVSGKPYRVLCAGQPPVDSRVWLRARLAGQGKPG